MHQMPIPRNLISDSALLQETFDLLTEKGGRATFTEIVDVIFHLANADSDLAASLVADLVNNDRRFELEPPHLLIAADGIELRPLPEVEFVVLDVEAIATKTQPARIIELGAYRVRAGEIIDEFQTLINPETRLPRFIAALTGISDEMLSASPMFPEIVDAWLGFAGDAVLVAHNSDFDLLLINREIARVYPGHRLRNSDLCTVELARHMLPNLESHKLDALADHFGIDIPERHRAAGDARATARILLCLLDQLELEGVRSLAEARGFRSRNRSRSGEPALQLALDV